MNKTNLLFLLLVIIFSYCLAHTNRLKKSHLPFNHLQLINQDINLLGSDCSKLFRFKADCAEAVNQNEKDLTLLKSALGSLNEAEKLINDLIEFERSSPNTNMLQQNKSIHHKNKKFFLSIKTHTLEKRVDGVVKGIEKISGIDIEKKLELQNIFKKLVQIEDSQNLDNIEKCDEILKLLNKVAVIVNQSIDEVKEDLSKLRLQNITAENKLFEYDCK